MTITPGRKKPGGWIWMPPLVLVLVLVSTTAEGSTRASMSSTNDIFVPSFLSSPAGDDVVPAHRQLQFGDFAAYPDSCPLVTSCPAVCVANATDCPTSCSQGLEQCDTGVCQENCTLYMSQFPPNGVENMESPCECERLPVLCAKPVEIYETCLDLFGDYYTNNTECVDAQEEALPDFDFMGPFPKACYIIISVTTLLVILWCCYNSILYPVRESTVETTVVLDTTGDTIGRRSTKRDFTNSSSTDPGTEIWTYTGYKYHPVGLFIYFLVQVNLWGIQVLLLILTILYYVQQEYFENWPWDPVFYKEVQVLMAFEVVWMVGFVWSFAFKYPHSTRDLFLRRCSLAQASFVQVHAPMKVVESSQEADATPKWGAQVMSALWMPLDLLMRLIFSMPPTMPGYETKMCRVKLENGTGKRGFYYRMRRFVYYDGKDDPAGDKDGSDDNPADDNKEEVANDNFRNDNEHNFDLPHVSTFRPGIMSVGDTLGDFLKQREGLSSEEAMQRFGYVGPNQIAVRKPTLIGSIAREFSKPFYLYQNFMVWTWAPYWYYYMAIINSLVRISGGIVVGCFQYMSDSVLYQLSHMEGQSSVLRDGAPVDIPNTDIVPGDAVVLQPGVVSQDMILLQGRLVVDESALTGEANPIVKHEVDPTLAQAIYDPHRHRSAVVSAGTEILEVGDGQNLGLVLSTGSFTSKGRLVTDVLSYQRHKFKFDDEVKIVLCIFILEAVILCSLVFHFISEDQWVYAWFYAMFIIGTVIPPLLPTVFVVSVGVSARRLQAKRITCTYQEGILVAGKVNTAFFDKTGTLTKQGMDFLGLEGAATTEMEDQMALGLSVCHTLHKTADGTLVGNNIDTVGFEYSGSSLVLLENGNLQVTFRSKIYQILKQYEFDSHRQTLSVIVEDMANRKRTMFVKGSPEAIRAMCVEKSLPDNFDAILNASAKSGRYTLAMAIRDYDFDKTVQLSDISRDDVETKLWFGSFVNFGNCMREETPAVIQELLQGDVTVSMITGDNVLTGICVAKEAGIITEGRRVFLAKKDADVGEVTWVDADTDQSVKKPCVSALHSPENNVALAITGEAWSALLQNDPKFATSIASHIRVFGRCNPNDKATVVTHFVEVGKKTLMCGDGGNDCGSLKSAHVGIALSTAEASVVAPFTSLDKTITSVPCVLREGRCALASSFAAYSYYIIYGQVESFIQTLNAYFAVTLTEWIWVMLDGVWSVSMAFTLPLAKAAARLSPTRPTASLLGPRTMFSVCGMLFWNFLFIVIGLAALFGQDWFQCRKWMFSDLSVERESTDTYESSLLFVVGGFQYVTSAVALNFGYEWRRNFCTNYIFVALVIVFAVVHCIIIIHPAQLSCAFRVNCENENAVRSVIIPYPEALANPWNTTLIPTEFRWALVVIVALNLLVLCLWQYVFVNGILAKKLTALKLAGESELKRKQSAIAASDSTQGSEKNDGGYQPLGQTDGSEGCT